VRPSLSRRIVHVGDGDPAASFPDAIGAAFAGQHGSGYGRLMHDHVSALVSEFVEKLVAAVEDEALVRARQTIVRGLDGLLPGRARAVSGRSASVRRSGPVTAARKRQGQYLGRLRRLSGRARQRVQALAREKGVAEAIKLADRLARV